MHFMLLILAGMLWAVVWGFFHANPRGVPRRALLACVIIFAGALLAAAAAMMVAEGAAQPATLGDMLGWARRSAAGFQKWAEAADPKLIDDVKEATADSGECFTGFVRVAIADFSRFADAEAWAQLSRMVRDSDDPGLACLVAMVRWRLAAPHCRDQVLRAR